MGLTIYGGETLGIDTVLGPSCRGEWELQAVLGGDARGSASGDSHQLAWGSSRLSSGHQSNDNLSTAAAHRPCL